MECHQNHQKQRILETVDCFNSKRLKCDHSDPLSRETIKKPEVMIICEKQEKLYCGRHALRALCQRLDLFSSVLREQLLLFPFPTPILIFPIPLIFF